MLNKVVLKNIYDSILELSSLQNQHARWITGKGGRISGYAELMCTLFDDCAFDLFVDKEAAELNLSKSFIQELQILRDCLNSYQEDFKTRHEIIDDPEWLKVVTQAQKVISMWEIKLQ